ncbi:hypothetical protein ACHQM5_029667 [Ranunculus cassubicifolius]
MIIVSAIQSIRIIIRNKYGENLVGLLHESLCSRELVILCHGFLSSKECRSLVSIANGLANEGISSFRFDFSGNGESEGSYLSGTYGREAEDLHAVVLHFTGTKRVIRSIVGHSKGANVVLLYASRYHDVRTLVNISGCLNLMRGVAERLGKDFMQKIKKDGFMDVTDKTGTVKYRITKEVLMDRVSTDVGKTCLLIKKDCRVLTVHGSRDELVPVKDAIEIDKLICNHKLHIIEGANHEYTWHQVELASAVVDFIRGTGKDMPNQSGSARL